MIQALEFTLASFDEGTMDYGRAVRTCRVAFGIQQKQLAVMSGVTPSYLSLIESGKRTPSMSTVEALCRALRVPAHLMLLLAADANELAQRPPEEVGRLARSLLEILVSTEQRGNSGQT